MFRRVLIANRGEIALRIMRSLRSLGIKVAIIYGKEDRLSLPVRLADEGIYIPRDDPLATYLDIEAIVKSAKEFGADAVHPGYGFLAENPTFARRLTEEGIKFIGPSSKVLKILGDKISARKIMAEAGLPVAKGSDSPISNVKEAEEIARQIGFPVIIKAAAGGGGIGMQIVNSKDNFESALNLCQGRALSAFGDDRVFIEKFIEGAQHIEFQVLSDGKNAIHFGERFCSIQRRHQKILEEGPWLDDEVRSKMGEIVVKGAKLVGYEGLATFEFLRDEKDNFYFLEVNPRVQVEHTVTEMIVGQDLVSLGIKVASGEEINISQDEIKITGHAIEIRINAENSFTLEPSPGRIWECIWPGGNGVRIDSHVHTGYDVPASFDSLLAKVIVWAPTRKQAIRKMSSTIDEIILTGVDTLIPLHKKILNEEDFNDRQITIKYLEEHPKLMKEGLE
ncbi:MAG: acetyl-CoA carboxylase biotin carboxylase subunit [Marine Group II euryarchaeote MED-G38]|nr:acetyl-CoA carboxylase biotin carboxylase subunit [Euryarchaeota archaeon]OUV26293.1 MAG: hypothetical protein CBC57_02770 [Euryarchaeota archaeon TMED97]PDH23654.1 MAG: acetyl-CoA carboxylase biotin carboxylase subunit [Marine Group II euryarchaeote MED-G38]